MYQNNCCQSKQSFSQSLKENIFGDSCVGDWGVVVIFIEIKIEGCTLVPCLISVSPDFTSLSQEQRPVSRSSVSRQSLVHFGLWPNCLAVLSRAVLLYPGLCLEPTLGVCKAAGHRRLLGPHGCYEERMNRASIGYQLRKKKVKLGLYDLGLEKDQAPYQTNQSTFQSFLQWVLSITNSFPRSSGVLCLLSNPILSPD